MSLKTCCVIDHRNIPANKLEYVKIELQKEVLKAIEDGYTHFISGFDEGAGLLFASIVGDLITNNSELTLEAAIPSRNRMNTTDELFHQLIGKCKIVGIHDEAYSPNSKKCRYFMISQSRRIIMVCDAQRKGEPFSTMQHINSQEREVRIIFI